MLTFEDCLAMTDLTEEEVEAIAEHEHCHEMVAMELGHCLIRTEEGVVRIRHMISDDISMARARGDSRHVARLQVVYDRFCEKYPQALRSDPQAQAG